MCLHCEDNSGSDLKHRTNRRRKKLWQLDVRMHCSVVGTCVSLQELRKIAQRARVTFERKTTDHDMHTAFVSISAEKNYPSQLLQKHLDQKFRGTIQQLGKTCSEQEIKQFWSKACEEGNVSGAYWALVTYEATPPLFMDQVFGDVHMLSHLSGASVRVDMQALTQLRKKVPFLEKTISENNEKSQRLLRDKEQKISSLNQELENNRVTKSRLEETEALLQQTREHGVTNHSETKQLSQDLAHARAQLEKWKFRADMLNDRTLELESNNTSLKAECRSLEETLERLITPDSDKCSNQDDYSTNKDLSGRTVLYVGGRNRQCAHFRALVEAQNGQFIHHDGGREDSKLQLDSSLSRADIVMCPLDCVSHGAMHKVKRYCDRNTKPLVFIPKASLSAFTQGLNKITA